MNKYAFYGTSGPMKGKSFGPFQALCRGSYRLPISEIKDGELMSTTYNIADLESFAVVDPNGSVIMINCGIKSTKTSSKGIDVEIHGGEG